jgi:hypothetical protein
LIINLRSSHDKLETGPKINRASAGGRVCVQLQTNDLVMSQPRIPTIDVYEPLIGAQSVERIRSKAEKFEGMRVANFNSTYYGGGVAEMLSSLTLLMNSLGLQTEWRVIQGTPDFFFHHKKNAQRAARGRNRFVRNQKRNFRTGDVRKQRAQFPHPRLRHRPRSATVAVD